MASESENMPSECENMAEPLTEAPFGTFSHKKMGLSEGDDFPKRADCGSLEEFQEKTKQCYEKLGLR